MAEEINKMLDELMEDFKYAMNFILDLFGEFPSYTWWEKKEEVKHIKEIQKKYFEGE